jgi:hypothetical protein
MNIYTSPDFINLPNEICIRHIQFDLCSCDCYNALKTVDIQTDTNLRQPRNVPIQTECSSCGIVHDNSWKWIDEIDGEYDLNTDKIKYPEGKKYIKERNILIQDIRDKFTIKNQKNRHARYGGYPSEYKSQYHKELFLEIVTALGLVKKETSKSRYVEITAREYDMQYNSNKYQEDELR